MPSAALIGSGFGSSREVTRCTGIAAPSPAQLATRRGRRKREKVELFIRPFGDRKAARRESMVLILLDNLVAGAGFEPAAFMYP